MSSTKYTLVFTHRAKKDLRDIFSYTLSKWGERKLEAYKAAIDATLHKIEKDPCFYPERGGVFGTHRSCGVEKHLVFYKIEGNVVRVSTILHGRMDAPQRIKSVKM